MKEQIQFYENKSAFEADPADLVDALSNEEKIIPINTRKKNSDTTPNTYQMLSIYLTEK